MGKLCNLSARVVCKILKSNGFHTVRCKGSHIVMQKHLEASTVTVIVPNHKEIKKGTLSSIIRQSKLDRSLFE